ncbi:hypothetical protein [Streptomyces sp. 7N604]
MPAATSQRTVLERYPAGHPVPRTAVDGLALPRTHRTREQEPAR